MRGECEVCAKTTDVLLTIYGQTGRRALRCSEHLNIPEDYHRMPKRCEEITEL